MVITNMYVIFKALALLGQQYVYVTNKSRYSWVQYALRNLANLKLKYSVPETKNHNYNTY